MSKIKSNMIEAELIISNKEGLDVKYYKDWIEMQFKPLNEIIGNKVERVSKLIEEHDKFREHCHWIKFIHYCRTGKFPED